ncbi:CBS domain-containing protein [Ideonella sp.]|uniref:CBS domain-containing protein n=1 Tax=Ideonella sp. TaxID=1929293 RepID=UPI002B4A7510|nr:CBS domain-containing protein [Ideonella sp.]HJV68651.1 CBS domain-containing protein [Ideonella sp.]
MGIGTWCERSVVTCGRDAPVLTLARLMRDQHVGDVVVVDEVLGGRPQPVGIVTDRDLVVRVLAMGVAGEALRAGDLLVHPLVTAHEDEDLGQAVWRMRTGGVRRLPVVDSEGGLVGVLTADDVTRHLAEKLGDVAHIVPRQLVKEQTALD